MSAVVRAGYKLTEVGVIPEDWEVRPLMSAVRIANGQVDPRCEPYKSMTLVAPDHIEGKTGRLLDKRTAADQKAVSGKYLFSSGDIVYSKIRPYLRKAVLVSFSGLCSADMYPLKAMPDVDIGFMLPVLLGERFSGYAESVSARSGMPKINRAELAEYSFALPPLPEQRAIATALSDVDALLAKLDALIAKKRDLKTATMQQLLTGQTRLPGFSGAWEVKPFVDIFYRVNAKAHQIQASDYQETGDYPVVDQGKDLVIGYTDRGDKRYQCPVDGVIVFGDHTCIIKFINFDFVVGADGTQILSTKNDQCVRFHAFHLEHNGIATTGYNRHFKFLKERTFFAPSIAEQTAIATILSDMDTELTALEARRDKTRVLKQGMMQVLLTGEIRLL